MQKIYLIVTILFINHSAFADLVQKNPQWGKYCQSSDSYSFRLHNTSDKPVDVKVCLEQHGQQWHCYIDKNVQPGAIFPADKEYRVCHGTGIAQWWVRANGDYNAFPHPY